MPYFENLLLQSSEFPPPGYVLVDSGRRVIRDDDMVFTENQGQWAPAYCHQRLVGARVETDGVMGVAARRQ